MSATLLHRFPLPEQCTLELHLRAHPTHPFIVRLVDDDAAAIVPMGMLCFPDESAARRWCVQEQRRAERACDTMTITVTS